MQGVGVRGLVGVVGVVGLAACYAPPSSESPPETVRLEVRNDAVFDAVVYAYRSGQRMRLGLVVAHTTTTLVLPLLYTDNGLARLYVHQIGERDQNDFLSEAVQLVDGGHPVFFLTPDLQASSLAVFPDPDR